MEIRRAGIPIDMRGTPASSRTSECRWSSCSRRKPGERILDLGCGDGALTAKLVAMGCEVVGVDASEPQIRGARAMGLDARVMDGEHLTFDSEFDAVFSNAALHWMRHRRRSHRGSEARTAKPRGRFVAEMGGHRCVEKIRIALVDALNRRGLDGSAAVPWYFHRGGIFGAPHQRRLYHEIHRADSAADAAPRRRFRWLETFAENFTSKLAPADRPAFIDEVREVLRPQLCDDSGKWTADYTRLRFAAQRAD